MKMMMAIPPVKDETLRPEEWQVVTDKDNASFIEPGTLLEVRPFKLHDERILYYLVPDANGRSSKGWQSQLFLKGEIFLVLPGACERRQFKAHQIQLPVLWGEQAVVLWIDNRDLGLIAGEPLSLANVFNKLSSAVK